MEEKRDGYSFADEEGKRAAKKAMEWIAYKDRTKKNWKINCIVPVFRKKHLSRRWIMLCHSVILMTEGYVENYLMFQTGKRSKKEIYFKLQQKGFPGAD